MNRGIRNSIVFWLVALAFSILFIKAPAYANTVTVDETDYLAGERINVAVSLTGSYQDYYKLGVFAPSTAVCGSSLTGTVSALADAPSLLAPKLPGTYQVRLQYCNTYNATLDYKTITVHSNSANPGDIGLDKGRYLVKDTVTATIKGLTPGQIISSGAWAGLYRPTDAYQNNAYESKSITLSTLADNKTWTFEAPQNFGTYQIRVFTANVGTDPANREAVLFGTIQFEVGSTAARPGNLSVNKTSFKPGETVKASISGLSAGQLASNAWAGLYLPTDGDLASTQSIVPAVAIRSLRDLKTWAFTAPSVPGFYEIRVYTDNVSANSGLLKNFGIIRFFVAPTKRGSSIEDVNLIITQGKQIVVKKGKSVTLGVKAKHVSGTGITVSANSIVSYKTSNKKIASVSTGGVVKGLKTGSCYVTVISGSIKKTVKIVVR